MFKGQGTHWEKIFSTENDGEVHSIGNINVQVAKIWSVVNITCNTTYNQRKAN